jgi:molybdenum cofactor cytidylyltransferase
MGRFKLTLPWGERTVVGQVVATLEAAGVGEIVVVTGHREEEVIAALAGRPIRCVHNADYMSGEMLRSIQVGLAALDPGVAAALLCLGDQPQMEVDTVRGVLAVGAAAGWRRIVIPSHRMRGGHPIGLPAWLWPEILACRDTLRDVLARRRAEIEYLTVETPSILADLDTPEDYEALRLTGTTPARTAPAEPDER